MEHTHRRAIGMKAFQKAGTIHARKSSTVNAQVQLLKIHPLNLRLLKNMHIFRPKFLFIRAFRANVVVIARCNKHRNLHPLQRIV